MRRSSLGLWEYLVTLNSCTQDESVWPEIGWRDLERKGMIRIVTLGDLLWCEVNSRLRCSVLNSWILGTLFRNESCLFIVLYLEKFQGVLAERVIFCMDWTANDWVVPLNSLVFVGSIQKCLYLWTSWVVNCPNYPWGIVECF